MRIKKQTARIGTLAILSLQWGCDPAFDYEPENWAPSGAHNWQYRSDEFDVQTHSLRGIVGSTSVGLTLEVTNHTDRPLVMEGAVLLSEGREPYYANLAGKGELEWRTVGAKQSGWLDVSWEFTRPVAKVLGDRPQLTLRFRLGEDASEVQIQFKRVE